jgi:peptide/nickel transport system permease protein
MAHDTPSDGEHVVDEEEFGRGTIRPSNRVVGFAVTVAVLVGLYVYDRHLTDWNDPLLEGAIWPFAPWNLTRFDWLLAFSLAVFAFTVLVPLALERRRTAEYWRRLRKNTPAVLALAYLVVLFVVALVAPIVGRPTLEVTHSYQPPLFASIGTGRIVECTGHVVDGRCYGSLTYPFGTTFGGKDVLKYTLAGARVPLAIALVTSAFIVPLATTVGTVAAYAGGLVDDALMRLVDVVQTVPPLIAYIIVRFVIGGGGGVVLMLAIFGLFSWGNVARLVRSEALAQREELFVTAAESAGGSPLYVVRKHLVPNVSSTVVTATTLQIPTLVLTEAALSFLGIGPSGLLSWGGLIAAGTIGTQWASMTEAWWVSTVPVAMLSLTVVCLSVLGDALRDVLDPRFE